MRKVELLVLVVSALLVAFSSYSFALYVQSINDSITDEKEEGIKEEQTTPLSGFLIKLPIYGKQEIKGEFTDMIDINLSYNSGTEWDPDDNGIESKEGVVDLTARKTEFGWPVNESNLCTKWIVLSEDTENYEAVCLGSKKACNFLYLDSQKNSNWNDPLFVHYERYGATSNNTVSAQVFYIDYSTEIDDLYSDIRESEMQRLPVLFK
ncbi:MAG: hypothetical protein PHV16_00300 [Candidatus Nanoarchaeia archaeon]|nr:hypothetical protein [Candidatus Nanoarchaeia archaeon]